MTLVTINFFNDTTLDSLAQEILDLDVNLRSDMEQIIQFQKSAMYRAWYMGKIVFENEAYINEKLGSQKAFAEGFGYNEQVISRNKNGYKYLYEAGCKKWEDVVSFLDKKAIAPTTYNWERIGKLLHDPSALKPKERVQKEEKRLEQLYAEVEEIVNRTQGANNNVFELGKNVLKQIEDAQKHIGKIDPFKSNWRSENYLAFVRNLGYDFIMNTPCEQPDPHHTLPNGKSSVGQKVADVFTIPVSRDTHEAIEQGIFIPDELDIAYALIRTMALYITHNTK